MSDKAMKKQTRSKTGQNMERVRVEHVPSLITALPSNVIISRSNRTSESSGISHWLIC
jgi:hypothetical protein